MELSLLTKTKIAISVAMGGILIGFLLWPMVSPADLQAPLTAPNFTTGLILVAVSLVVGFLAGLLGAPYCIDIGILAVPAGLAVWAWRSGTVGSFMQHNQQWQQRQEFFLEMRLQVLFWFLMFAAGLLGSLLAGKFVGRQSNLRASAAIGLSGKPKNIALSAVLAFIATAVIVIIGIRIFVQSEKIGPTLVQPYNSQIAFGVLFAFGIAAFVVGHFLNAGYIWPILATAIINVFAINAYATEKVFETMASTYPAVCLPAPILAVLPVQTLAFGVLGSVAGYWIAVHFDYWRKHEMG